MKEAEDLLLHCIRLQDQGEKADQANRQGKQREDGVIGDGGGKVDGVIIAQFPPGAAGQLRHHEGHQPAPEPPDRHPSQPVAATGGHSIPERLEQRRIPHSGIPPCQPAPQLLKAMPAT